MKQPKHLFMLNKHIRVLLISFFAFSFTLFAQNNLVDDDNQIVHIGLPRLTTLDEIGSHLTRFGNQPKVDLILPPVDKTGAKYFSLFYSHDADVSEVWVMVFPSDTADLLYIDLNRDYNLTNDNSPYLFPTHQDDFNIDITSRTDPNQKTRMVLQRKGAFQDIKPNVDSLGNIVPKLLNLYQTFYTDTSFTGKRKTFYFDNCVTLRRGEFSVNNAIYQIGIFDYNNNGLFNEERDLLLIDVNQNGTLEFDEPTECFKLNDIFVLDQNRFKVNNVDKYGNWLEIKKTSEELTFYYLRHIDSLSGSQVQTGNILIDHNFWQISKNTLDEKTIDFKNYKGKYILLNFWGEWCKPCLTEIPELVEANKKYSNLQIISFLSTTKLENAKKVIKEKGITWPQILLSKDIQEKFRIKAYPTNILIYPDGKTAIQRYAVTKIFFEEYVK